MTYHIKQAPSLVDCSPLVLYYFLLEYYCKDGPVNMVPKRLRCSANINDLGRQDSLFLASYQETQISLHGKFAYGSECVTLHMSNLFIIPVLFVTIGLVIGIDLQSGSNADHLTCGNTSVIEQS